MMSSALPVWEPGAKWCRSVVEGEKDCGYVMGVEGRMDVLCWQKA
jgi:hypothetical protein